MLLANLTLPSTSTSIAVGGLEGGNRYAFRAAAWTLVGLGPSSPAIVLSIEMNQSTSTVPMTDQEAPNSFPTHVAQVKANSIKSSFDDDDRVSNGKRFITGVAHRKL
jgi:roundabout axon guidance receptor 2